MDNWKIKFVLLWIGQEVSLITSSVLQMAIVWYLTKKTASATVLSIATLIGFVPQAILGVFIGAYIDRYSRKLIMIVSDLFIALVSLLLILTSQGSDISISMIMFVLFVRSIATSFHQPSLQAVTPTIVPKDKITQCVGFSQSFESIAMIFSPAIAGVLYGIFDLKFIVLLDCFGAIIAVTLLLFIKIPYTNRQMRNSKLNILEDAKQAIKVIKSKKGLSSLLIVSALYAIIYFPVGTLYPLITLNYFGGTITQSSIVEMIFSIGMLLGSLFLGMFGSKIKKSTSLVFSLMLYGIGLTIVGLLPIQALYLFFLISVFLGVSVPFYTGVETAVLQTKIEDKYLGRVMSLSSSITMIAMPVGLVLSGLFASRIGINRWFFISGIGTLIISFVVLLLPSIKQCCDND